MAKAPGAQGTSEAMSIAGIVFQGTPQNGWFPFGFPKRVPSKRTLMWAFVFVGGYHFWWFKREFKGNTICGAGPLVEATPMFPIQTAAKRGFAIWKEPHLQFGE